MTPWQPDINPDSQTPVLDAIYQALGSASVCWSNPEAAGVFDSTRATEIGAGLHEWLTHHLGLASS